MKTKSLILLLFVSIAMFAAIPQGGQVLLYWDYPPDENNTNIVFHLWRTKTPTVTNSWQLIATIPGPATNASITIDPNGNSFFYLTASNAFWGAESDPSNVALIPSWPRSGVIGAKRQ